MPSRDRNCYSLLRLKLISRSPQWLGSNIVAVHPGGPFDPRYSINLCFAPDCHSNSIHNRNFPKRSRQKPIFQELISRVPFEIETRGQVFCIALGSVTICIAIRTIGLLNPFYNTE